MDVAAASPRSDAVMTQASAAMLRTALDQQVASSTALLEALPQPPPLQPAASLEAHLGRRLDVYG